MTRPEGSRTRLFHKSRRSERRELYPAVLTLKIYTGPFLSETSQMHACGNPNLYPLERERERASKEESESE